MARPFKHKIECPTANTPSLHSRSNGNIGYSVKAVRLMSPNASDERDGPGLNSRHQLHTVSL